MTSCTFLDFEMMQIIKTWLKKRCMEIVANVKVVLFWLNRWEWPQVLWSEHRLDQHFGSPSAWLLLFFSSWRGDIFLVYIFFMVFIRFIFLLNNCVQGRWFGCPEWAPWAPEERSGQGIQHGCDGFSSGQRTPGSRKVSSWAPCRRMHVSGECGSTLRMTIEAFKVFVFFLIFTPWTIDDIGRKCTAYCIESIFCIRHSRTASVMYPARTVCVCTS